MTDSDDTPSTQPTDPALASFVLLAQFLGVPADAQQIHHGCGQGDRPYTFDDPIRVAKKLGQSARRKEASLAELPRLPLPALVRLNDDDTAILLKIDDSGEEACATWCCAPMVSGPRCGARPMWPSGSR